ncbi:MAG: phosphatidate cytidylyltransferase [Planctomycetes bacterium]|nr:phosphatidate cytidylyltransferase [Planctomycetota bacterium]
MTWRAALDSPVFVTFAGLLIGLLAVAGLLLLVLRRVTGSRLEHAVRSYRGWTIMVPLFLAAIFLGRAATIVLFAILALFGMKEFARGTGLYRDWWMTGVVDLAIVGVFVCCLVSDPSAGVHGWLGMFQAMPVYAVALILLVPILRDRTEGQLQAMALGAVGFVYIGWMFGHLAFVANSPHAYGYILYLVFAVEANDIAAYVCGKRFGRRALRPRISPNKTLGGALGAIVVSMALPFAFRFALPHFATGELLLTGVIVGVGGQLGDLSISVIKRDLGVKDMGALIPGHGGILDRLDSLIFVSPMFFHMVHYCHGIYAVA